MGPSAYMEYIEKSVVSEGVRSCSVPDAVDVEEEEREMVREGASRSMSAKLAGTKFVMILSS